MTTPRLNPTRRSTTPLALLIAMTLSLPSAVGLGQESATRDNYMAATIEMGCNAVMLSLRTLDDKREQINDKILKKHGFSRSSYAQAGFAFAQDAALVAEARRRIIACPKPDPLDLLAERYKGTFKAHKLEGEAEATVTDQKITLVIEATFDGEKISVKTTLDRAANLSATGQTAWKAGTAEWSLSGTISPDRLRGTFSLSDDRRQRRRASFNLTPAP